ncbi:hypothetical protein Q75_05840 [Bacillus coahuilensis p1.1.43]|uniref:Uncharacterized protein n=1 Tax=Bacillus coahuilensis p1.1.43 TaxID=1150625 RepID=A0A147K9F9_9BACI|nr:CBO0543 family protein [Bacillus coahuilensis]KUP07050.1 hypothetical protein Q75_05840 [Bacillus coahuilensis p1.1.43]
MKLYHAFIITTIILFSLRKGNWRNWREYLPTMYYFSFFNLFYQYITFTIDRVWELKKLFVSMFVTDVLYTFLVYPAVVVMFLGNYSDNRRVQFYHYAKYITVSMSIETLAAKLHYIEYFNGWTIWWTLFFYCTMFPLLRLHHVYPLRALVISFGLITFYLCKFDFSIL